MKMQNNDTKDEGLKGNEKIEMCIRDSSQFFSCLPYANFSCKVAFDYFYFFYWFYLTLSEHENTPISVSYTHLGEQYSIKRMAGGRVIEANTDFYRYLICHLPSASV